MMPLLLAPLEMLYSGIVRARNAHFDRTSAQQRLLWPVVSIGNLSLGGAGKTPLVISLATLLQAGGFHPDVLSRGYGRSEQTVERVDRLGAAERFGDEPLLIARSTGLPVYVGASRFRAGRLAEAERQGQSRGVHLLDDGFQHRRLARALDIVVVHRSDLEQRLLPAGRLREPLSSLRRADVIVLRQEDAGLEPLLDVYAGAKCRYWRIRRNLALPGLVSRSIAFCGIARPAEFFENLRALGAEMVEQVRFRDHHRYTAADIEHLAELGQSLRCDGFVTTDKDAVKLDAVMRSRLNAVAPLQTAQLTVELEDPAAALDLMRKSLIVPE
ncbi:MAG: tetraacyldisaccharide 4'-kinase [Acidobacteriaceae bacterium]